FQFSLKWLLLTVLVVSLPLGWLSYKRHLLDVEYRTLRGEWAALAKSGDPIIVNGQELVMEITPRTTTLVDVSSDIRSIDFHTSKGNSEAIYRCEGDRIRIRQVSEGARRPASFDKHEMTLKPGAAAGS